MGDFAFIIHPIELDDVFASLGLCVSGRHLW